jgi:hypothetical protein
LIVLTALCNKNSSGHYALSWVDSKAWEFDMMVKRSLGVAILSCVFATGAGFAGAL